MNMYFFNVYTWHVMYECMMYQVYMCTCCLYIIKKTQKSASCQNICVSILHTNIRRYKDTVQTIVKHVCMCTYTHVFLLWSSSWQTIMIFSRSSSTLSPPHPPGPPIHYSRRRRHHHSPSRSSSPLSSPLSTLSYSPLIPLLLVICRRFFSSCFFGSPVLFRTPILYANSQQNILKRTSPRQN